MNEIIDWKVAENKLNKYLEFILAQNCSSYDHDKKNIIIYKLRFDRNERTIDLFNSIMACYSMRCEDEQH